MAELNCDRNWSELFENCPLLSHAEVVERGDAVWSPKRMAEAALSSMSP